MKPRRTPSSNCVYHLNGGNEDNDLWATVSEDADGDQVIVSVWELDDHDRQVIASGGQIVLIVWGGQQPPVALTADSMKLGRGTAWAS